MFGFQMVRHAPRAGRHPCVAGWAPPLLGRAAIVAAMLFAGVAEAMAGGPAAADTAGTALVEWVYDTWTSPWTQVSGDPLLLSPGSYATFVVLTCASADLERERAARHLSPDECEHRMAAIRAEQDTALVFRVHLRVFAFPGAQDLARLSSGAFVTLEDDRGRRWLPEEVKSVAMMPTVTGQKLRRYSYDPPWARPDRGQRYAVMQGKDLLIGEVRVRFPRRDPGTGTPVIESGTRWLSLRVTYAGSEWVSTWKFTEPTEGSVPVGRDRDGRRQQSLDHGGER